MNMKNKTNKTKIISLNLIVAGFGFLLALNIAIAHINPGYASALSGKIDSLISAINKDNVTLISGISPVLTQGGVKGINLKKVEESTKKKVEGATQEGEEAAPAKPQKPAAAPTKEAKKKKAPVKIDPQVLQKAFEYFNLSLLDRDVILIGQQDKVVLGNKTIDKPYISKSFRDNPFDEVQEVDIKTGLTLKQAPEPPFYPPPGGSTITVTGEQFKDYVENLKLNGVIVVKDKFYALIRSGNKSFYKTKGDSYKEKFTVNVDDITLDAVVISDEFGNKGILDFNYRRGYQVQPIEDAVFITNLGVGE